MRIGSLTSRSSARGAKRSENNGRWANGKPPRLGRGYHAGSSPVHPTEMFWESKKGGQNIAFITVLVNGCTTTNGFDRGET
jgi:hypothetical protein